MNKTPSEIGTKDIQNHCIVQWTARVICIVLLSFLLMVSCIVFGPWNFMLIMLGMAVSLWLFSRWIRHRAQYWDNTRPPGDGPKNFPGGSRVPRVPITPQLSGSEAKHLATPYVTYAHYHAFAETESEMRRGSNALWRRIENL